MSSVKTEPVKGGASSTPAPSSTVSATEHEPREDLEVLMDELGDAVADYCHKRPGVAGGLLFAVGFFIGWRLKPW